MTRWKADERKSHRRDGIGQGQQPEGNSSGGGAGRVPGRKIQGTQYLIHDPPLILPEQINPIGCELAVAANQPQALCLTLRHQHAVEGITVMLG